MSMEYWNKQSGRNGNRARALSVFAAAALVGVAFAAPVSLAQQTEQPAPAAKKKADSSGTSWFKLCKDRKVANAGTVSTEKACTTHFEIVGDVPGFVSLAIDIADVANKEDRVHLTLQIPSAAALPFGLQPALPPGVQIVIDEDKPITLPFTFCHINGCIATATGPKSVVDKFKKGNEVKIIAHNLQGKPQTIAKVSLNGFTKVYDGQPFDLKEFETRRNAAIEFVKKRRAELQKKAVEAAKKKQAEQQGQKPPAKKAQ